MTRSQVRYLLGTPMVPDAFDKDRWDYLYYLKIGRLRRPLERHLIVYFQDDKVSKFDNQGAQAMPDAEKRETEPGSARRRQAAAELTTDPELRGPNAFAPPVVGSCTC